MWQGLMTSDEVFFEVKRNLQKKTDYDRLVGQITALDPSKRKIIVVLVGDTSKELLGRLMQQFKTELEDTWMERLRIVTISI